MWLDSRSLSWMQQRATSFPSVMNMPSSADSGSKEIATTKHSSNSAKSSSIIGMSKHSGLPGPNAPAAASRSEGGGSKSLPLEAMGECKISWLPVCQVRNSISLRGHSQTPHRKGSGLSCHFVLSWSGCDLDVITAPKLIHAAIVNLKPHPQSHAKVWPTKNLLVSGLIRNACELSTYICTSQDNIHTNGTSLIWWSGF